MIEQEAVETPVEEKSMSRLAEILKGRLGLHFLCTREAGFYDDDPLRSELYLECEGHVDVSELADIVVEHGYKRELIGIDCHWSFDYGQQSDLPCWMLIFKEADC